ncbi:uncharacterized protein TRIADDRAFT_21020, partial [Trichoplax adhaerens]
ELEKLNALASEINRHEKILDNARSDFEKSLKEGTKKLTELAQELGSCIAKSRPYYETAERANALQHEFEKASLAYETASTVHEAAREMIAVAEENLLNRSESSFDGAWQDMVNHANNKVISTYIAKSSYTTI